MPYIEKARKAASEFAPKTAGELTFAIQQLMKFYIGDAPDYQRYAECLGALRGAELDLWDRKIQPYERAKCAQNGDVW